ncbi:MAG TPA: ATPase, T2SS/T4P/T4SS family, partial [Kofleriaceae bacterium]
MRPYRIRCSDVSGQLEQILAYLDRDGVSELVISIGRPIAMKQKGAYVNLTARPLTLPMLSVLVEGSALAGAMPKTDGSFDPIELDVGRRRLRVRSGRRGDEIVLRLEVVAKPAAAAPSAVTFAPKKPSFASPELSLDDDVPELTLEPAKAAAPAPAPIVEPQYIEAPRSGRIPPPALSKLVAAARAAKASDLHISANRVTQMRVGTDLVPVDSAPLSAEAAEAILLPLLDDEQRARLAQVGYVDLAVDATDRGRLRANISRHQAGLKGTFRLAMAKPATLEELGLPKDLAKVVAHHQGFVVIAGPSGHGKTTTLNALVDLINSTKAFHILTVEDPIEIEHPRKVAVVSQREAGRHTKSFAAALKASLREDPDVIVIGELRDRETVEIALTASETGHLVLATMSTPSAAKTLDRLIDMFPPEEHSQVRASIAGALRAIV